MSVRTLTVSAQIPEVRHGLAKRRIVLLTFGTIASLLIAAGVWILAAVLPSKTGSPIAPLRAICDWIYQTRTSVAIRESSYAFPLIEGIHLLGIGISVGMLCWFDLRLVGVAMTDQSVSKVWKRVMPTAFVGFIVMFITGGLLFWAEAATAYNSMDFWIKMGLLLLAGINAGYFELSTHRHAHEWDNGGILPLKARLAGAFSLLLWIAIIVTGRTMAYSF